MKSSVILLIFTLPLSLIAYWLNWPDAENHGNNLPQAEAFRIEESAESMVCPCTVTQGSFSSPLPFLTGNVPATTFYQYGVPSGSSANTGLELSNTLVMMLYEDVTTGDVSLVFIADLVNDGSGGDMDITFNCMPNSAFVQLSDDAGELFGSPPSFTGNFNWAACCTDGGIIGGLGCGYTFTINPDITSGINTFSLVHGTQTNPIYIPMPILNCPITVNCGGAACCVESFEFSGVVQNASCSNSSNGSVNLSTDCATSPAFQWSNGATTEDISNVTPGTYSVTITANGCSQVGTYTVGANSPAPQPVITGPTAFCSGQTAVLGVNGSYTTYQWSNGQQAPSIAITTGGTYSVTVTNASGCTGIASINVTLNPSPAPVITGPSSICFGQTVMLNAGAGYTSYLWSTGANSPTILVNQPGGYSVTVTNNFGCPGVATAVVQPLPSPLPVITGPTSLCTGETIVLNATGNFSSYAWSTGANTPTINVTVTNSSGCTGSAALTVTQTPGPTPSIAGPTGFCPGDTVVLTATAGYSAYQWSSGQSAQAILVSTPGVYSVTVTDAQGCTGATSLQVDTLAGLNPQISGDLELCPGESSVLDAGAGYAIYQWSTGASSQNITVTTAGNYDVTVTSSGSCTGSASAMVAENTADTTYLFSTSCNPQDTGVFLNNLLNQAGCDSLVVSAVAFSAADTVYFFETSCNPQDTGLFVQTFTNQYGCDSSTIETVSLLPSDSLFFFSTSCNPLDTGVFVMQLQNQFGCDSIVVETVGFSEADTVYIFETSCNPLDTGVFIATYTNQYGCDSIEIETVTLLPSDTLFVFSESCSPQDTGVFVFNYTNQYGCDSIEIETVTLLPSDNVAIFSESCSPQDTGVFVFNYMNQYGCDSTVVETITLLPTDTTNLSGTTCGPLAAGTFITSYTNQHGCDSTVIETVTLLPGNTTTFVNLESCSPQDTGVVVLNLLNQYGCDSTVIVTTTLLPSDTVYLSGTTCDPMSAGTFMNSFANQYGCDSTVIETVTLLPGNTTTYVNEESCSPQDTGVVVLNLLNQYGCDSTVIVTTTLLPTDTLYLSGTTCDPLTAGTFVSSYTNQYGCDSTEILSITLLPLDSCALTVGVETEDVLCNGDSNGSIILQITGGNVPIQCEWMSQGGGLSGTATLAQFGDLLEIQGLPAGTYIVHLTDPNGLEWEQAITIGSPPPLTVGVAITSGYFGFGVSCAGGTDGSIQASAGGGVGGYQYEWSSGQTGLTVLSNLAAGAYALTVTDANGCEASAGAMLSEPAPLVATVSAIPALCADGGSVEITQITGGIPPYLISLDGGPFSSQQQFPDLGAGVHDIAIEDAVACIWTTEVVLPDLPEFWADLGPDTLITLGSSINLNLATNLFPIDTIIWSPLPPGAVCNNCITIAVSPQVTTEYTATVRGANGCEASDVVEVGVYRDKGFYVPNVISPNFDGINDQFMIYAGPSVLRIRKLEIFDRWGGKVFERAGFPPNDPVYGWGGRKDGTPVSAGVYVYQFEVEYLDGLTLLVAGDVTIVR
jgi:hypothetical protein